jgi:RNA polymerase-binding transcription factor DksA
MEENKDFMNQWMAEGKKNWQKNTKRREDAIARVKYFEDREVQAYKNKLEKELTGATRELIGGVNEFEQNL